VRPLDGPPGGDEAPLRVVEIAGDAGVLRVAVGVGHCDDALGQIVERGTQRAQFGPVGGGAHAAEPDGRRRRGQLGDADPGYHPEIGRGGRYDAPMLSRSDLRDARADVGTRVRGWTARGEHDETLVAKVAEILRDVRVRGDAAVVDATERYDGVRLTELRVPAAECADALGSLSPELRAALELAATRIEEYHAGRVGNGPAPFDRDGVQVTELTRPVARAGLYVPGGRASYPSTVLMTAIPARLAGVTARVLCVPPGADGRVPAITLAAAALVGVEEVYRVGGAQAIGALAYGTESIAAVDVIVGPGNAYVDAAKRAVAAEGIVGIDGPAGPSELVVVADGSVPAEHAALDLAAQAEHGPGGTAYVVAWDVAVLDAVCDALTAYVAESPRAEEIRSTLGSGGRAILVRDLEQAMAVANAVAPEHLELLVADGLADAAVDQVRHAGAVFVRTPTALGDYIAGPNHVLPTGGAARFSSALRVDDFQTHVHVVRATADGLAAVGPAAAALATAEGLAAHAASVTERMSS